MIDTIAMRRNISEIWAAIFGSEAEATVGELKIIDRNAGNTDLRFSPNGRNIFYSAWKWGQIRLLCVDNPVITKKAKRKGEIVKF